jgi:hypothetical protein
VDCGGWVSDKRQRTLCVERHGLEGELAIAQRRVELEAAANDAREALDNLASGAGPATANADAQTIARFAASLGYPIGADRVGDLLVILSVTLLELGGGLAFAVAGALRPSQPLECSLQGKQAGQGGALVAVPATADVEAQAERWGVPAIAAADVSPESPVAVETAPAASVELVPAATAKTARKAGTAPKRKLSQPSNVHPKPRRQNRVRPVACESQAEAGERILKLVSSSPDGTLPATGVRGLAKLIDASRATTHRALVGLVSTGVLAHAGDAIVLAAPGRAAA